MVESGADSNKDVHPILTDSNGSQYIIITDPDGHHADITSNNMLLTYVNRISDGTSFVVVDAAVNALTTINTPHHMIHEGKSFIVSEWFDNVADLGIADLRILAGANKALHASISVAAEGKGKLAIFEGNTYTDNGTPATIFDKNRTTANTSDALAYHTATVNAQGPKIYESFIPGGTKQRAIGSVRTNGEEWIFKKSTDYRVRFANHGGADMDIGIEIEFYEV